MAQGASEQWSGDVNYHFWCSGQSGTLGTLTEAVVAEAFVRNYISADMGLVIDAPDPFQLSFHIIFF